MIDAIPFETPSEQIRFVLVEGRANGSVPVRVLLDTGNAAPFDLIVSPELARRAGATAEESGEVASSGALGDAAVNFRPARFAEFSLGPVRLADVRVGISAAPGAVGAQVGAAIEAVAGYRFVEGRRIAIDYRARTLDLEAAAEPPAEAVPFAIAPARPLTLVRVMLNGRGPFVFALDTGASATLVSPETAAAAAIEGVEAVAVAGAGGASSAGARMGQVRIALGNVSLDGQPVAIAEVLGPVEAAAGTRLAGVLGATFFGTGRLTIDYGNHRLWFTPGG